MDRKCRRALLTVNLGPNDTRMRRQLRFRRKRSNASVSYMFYAEHGKHGPGIKISVLISLIQVFYHVMLRAKLAQDVLQQRHRQRIADICSRIVDSLWFQKPSLISSFRRKAIRGLEPRFRDRKRVFHGECARKSLGARSFCACRGVLSGSMTYNIY